MSSYNLDAVWSIIIHRQSYCIHIGGGEPFKSFSHISDLRQAPWPWLWIGSYGRMAYRRVSLNDLYLHAKFRSNRKKTFYGRTYGRTLRQTRRRRLQFQTTLSLRREIQYTSVHTSPLLA